MGGRLGPEAAGRSAARPTAAWSPRSTRPGRRTPRPRSPRRTRAFDDGPWPARPARERGDLLLRVADLLERDKADVARAESLDTGKRLVESEYDVDDVVARLPPLRPGRRRGRRARWSTPATPTSVSRIVHEPVGVCALITPWNYPLLQTVLEGRALPGRRQHLRPQAERAHPAHRDPADAAARRGRAARPASATWCSAPGRTPARRSPTDPRVDLVSFTGGLADRQARSWPPRPAP